MAKLWRATGTLLVSAMFSGETASGWQEVRFATPVAITANTTHVASYYTASGFYSVTPAYFAVAVYTPPLRALANGDGGGNGVYRYGRRLPHLGVQLDQLLGRRGLRRQPVCAGAGADTP